MKLTPLLTGVLENAAYDWEPLPILVRMVATRYSLTSPMEILTAVESLQKHQLLGVRYFEGAKFADACSPPRLEQLQDPYTRAKDDHNGLPAEGGQYYFKTTQQGRNLLPPDTFK